MSVPEGKTAGEPRKQHVVSRVLLDRWAVDGEVEAFNLTNGRQRPRSPSAEGWVEHFIRVGARGAEAEWKRVEDLAPAALDALESGCLFDHPDQVVTIRRLFALHVARSKGFRAIFQALLVHPWVGQAAERPGRGGQ